MGLVELPYFADDAAIPESLPTCAAIRSSTDVLSDTSTQRVVGVGLHFVVKYGSGVELKEGQNMLYVQQVTRVSVPRVYALFRESETGEKYIVMERINGRRLDVEWGLLSQYEKHVIACKLKASFEELRQLPSPGGFCSVGKGPLLDDIFWTDGESASLRGPFATESDLNQALLAKYLYNNHSKYKADFYERALPSLIKDGCAFFTHGDLQGKNILLGRQSEGSERDQGGFEITLIDWEFSGWYPSYWEFAKAFLACGRWENDWSLFLEMIVPHVWRQSAWIDTFLSELIL